MGNALLQYATVFMLTIFVGVEIIAKVPSILQILGFLAVILAALNVVGGFVVTDRMLEMFKPKAKTPKAGSTSEVAK